MVDIHVDKIDLGCSSIEKDKIKSWLGKLFWLTQNLNEDIQQFLYYFRDILFTLF